MKNLLLIFLALTLVIRPLSAATVPADKPIVPLVLALIAELTTAEVVTIGFGVAATAVTVKFASDVLPVPTLTLPRDWTWNLPPDETLNLGFKNPPPPQFQPNGGKPDFKDLVIRLAFGTTAGYLAFEYGSKKEALNVQYNRLYTENLAFKAMVDGMEQEFTQKGWLQIPVSVSGKVRYRIIKKANDGIICFDPAKGWTKVVTTATAIETGKYEPTEWEYLLMKSLSTPRPGSAEWKCGIETVSVAFAAYKAGNANSDQITVLQKFSKGECMGDGECEGLRKSVEQFKIKNEMDLERIIQKAQSFEILTLSELTFLRMSIDARAKVLSQRNGGAIPQNRVKRTPFLEWKVDVMEMLRKLGFSLDDIMSSDENWKQYERRSPHSDKDFPIFLERNQFSFKDNNLYLEYNYIVHVMSQIVSRHSSYSFEPSSVGTFRNKCEEFLCSIISREFKKDCYKSTLVSDILNGSYGGAVNKDTLTPKENEEVVEHFIKFFKTTLKVEF